MRPALTPAGISVRLRVIDRGELALAAILALPWLALAFAWLADSSPGQRSHFAGVWWCSPESMASMGHGSGSVGVAGTLPSWLVMCAAMMLPATMPAIHHVAHNSLRRRRGRAVAGFLLAYLAVWALVGVPTQLASNIMPTEGLGVSITLLLAAAWELTPLKRLALRACHRSTPIPLWGGPAAVGVMRFGTRNATACVGSCWALMLISAPAGPLRILPMGGISALVWLQKRTRYPRRLTRRTALVLMAFAAVALVLA